MTKSMKKRPSIRFSEEQEQLLEVAENFCRDRFPMAAVRKAIAASEDFDPALWNEIVSLGWLGTAIPEEFGGSGLGLAEVVTLVEPMGRALAGTPFVGTTLAAQALLAGGTMAQKNAWLPRICEGAIATLALRESDGDWDLTRIGARAEVKGDRLFLSGIKTFVTDAANADLIIVSVLHAGNPALVLLEGEALKSLRLERETVIDETRRSYRVTLDGIEVPAANLLDSGKTADCLRHIDKAACLILAAEMCGGLAGVLDVTVDYLNTRKQFDRLIGSYQALKHPTVDMLLGLEASRSHLYYAASVFDDPDEGDIAVAMAKAQASEAFAFGSDRSIQFHGGFGFTYDCDAQLYRRRALWCEYQHGDAAYHRARLADLLL